MVDKILIVKGNKVAAIEGNAIALKVKRFECLKGLVLFFLAVEGMITALFGKRFFKFFLLRKRLICQSKVSRLRLQVKGFNVVLANKFYLIKNGFLKGKG